MAGDLAERVANINDASKVRIGYSVNSYESVLSALQSIYGTITNTDSTIPQELVINRERVTRDVTTIGSINVGSHISTDGFVLDGTDYTRYRQQQVVFGAFMPFVVKIGDESYIIPYRSPNERLRSGISAITGKSSYPIPELDKTYCEGCLGGLGSLDNSFEVGIGVDLTDNGTVDTFFRMCYPEIFKVGCAQRAVAKNALLAELAFVNGGTASTLHVKVIANSGQSLRDQAHTVYLPIPLLLTSDFRTLASVSFATGERYTVGQGNCTYLLANSKYNHKTASLDSFTPRSLIRILKNDNRVLRAGEECSVTFNTTATRIGMGYVRFYIQEGKDINGVFATDDIPKEYQEELYKGLGGVATIKEETGEWEQKANLAYGIGAADTCLYQDGQVDWEALRSNGNLANYYPYKDEIEGACRRNNVNTRLLIAHSAHETGCLTSVAWKKRFNPAGLLAGSRKPGEVFTMYGVKCTVVGADNIGVDGKSHGKFIKIDTSADAWELFAAWVTRSSFYGIKTKSLLTVGQYVNAMEWGVDGGASFCGSKTAHCDGYADAIMSYYEKIKPKNQP